MTNLFSTLTSTCAHPSPATQATSFRQEWIARQTATLKVRSQTHSPCQPTMWTSTRTPSRTSPGPSIRLIARSFSKCVTSTLDRPRLPFSITASLRRFSNRRVTEPRFQHGSSSLSRSRKRLKKPFRYMDLPAELRLLIAEYALVAEEPLAWHWVEWTPTYKSVTFMNINNHNGLTRVSRQLRAELRPAFWKVNTFEFDEAMLSRPHHPEPRNQTKVQVIAIIAEAYRFFVAQARWTVVPSLRAVDFRMGFVDHSLRAWPSWPDKMPPIGRHLDDLAQLAPNIRLRLLDGWWTMEENCINFEQALSQFLYVGGVMKGRELADAGETRSWKLLPVLVKRDSDWLLKNSKASADAARALEWVENGI
jgi:hypothetical protein